MLAVLPESVKACAREGLAGLSLVAGDGTKLKANAAMAGNLTAEQLDAEIAELESWIDAGLRDWVQDVLDVLDAEGTPPPPGPGDNDGNGPGGDDRPGDGDDGGGKKKWKKKPGRAEQMLERRLAARARLEALRDKQREKNPGPALAELAALAEVKEAALRRWEDKARARLEARAAEIAAGRKPCGRAPFPVDQDREVIRARKALAAARGDHEQALAGTPVPRKTRKRKTGTQAKRKPKTEADLKVNPADPSSRVMPLKKGGFDQLFNVQALATAKAQVIIAIMRPAAPSTSRPSCPSSPRPAASCAPPASASRFSGHCSTPGTPATPTSPPPSPRPSTSPSPARAARPAAPTKAATPASSPAGRT